MKYVKHHTILRLRHCQLQVIVSLPVLFTFILYWVSTTNARIQCGMYLRACHNEQVQKVWTICLQRRDSYVVVVTATRWRQISLPYCRLSISYYYKPNMVIDCRYFLGGILSASHGKLYFRTKISDSGS